jgi:hypothetical protein
MPDSPPSAAESLLARAREEGRARLRLYIGAAPGVGKSYRMLEDAHELKRQGLDVVVGFIEPHGRADTLARIGDLEQVPLREIEYRGVTLREMDLAGVLARKPQVALVDELAHTNVPGSAHQKRYEDVIALLDAGINVISAVNIQHIESLNDVVASTTSVRVRETIPDWVLKRADEVVNVDVSVETLRTRLRQGKIYDAAKIEQALSNFFRKGNLTALRELALRQLASDQAGKAQAYREREGLEQSVIPEKVMVAIGQGAGLSRARGARAVGHPREGDGGDRLPRQREDAAARRLAHRGAAGDRLVRGLRGDAEGRARPHQARGSRRPAGQHPVRRAARRESREAQGIPGRGSPRRFREAGGDHARHLRAIGPLTLGSADARVDRGSLPARRAQRDGADRPRRRTI